MFFAENNEECKFCFSDNKKHLIRPCRCTDKVHISCLREWNNTRKRLKLKFDKCEICRTKYNYNNRIDKFYCEDLCIIV